ncbi:uncharacterized protein Z519_04989 [Cladophialophora bantiana CBS 173.52]|uniref:Beta-glucuronidase C-terminal domain-containing protein n=1 Tax=Cladophialophora bantiana (strain ATCC 10958 / CBS 173.52 / CDC B-1940 / NIH 8579) TaxID=1442370 RepID=A0A0D2IE33_CLAB1|nr:uncharacterized protein Z519_04989 [Cladophialophora bantiana CBS 173.52]KIW95009.1 hypothetical protein Z519_04989 [Cladophialophora bantiana CBS 173.52]
MSPLLLFLPLSVLLPVLAGATQKVRQIVVNASSPCGQLRQEIQGSLSADSDFIFQAFDGASDLFCDYQAEIGALFPECGIKHVLIYNFPQVFLGWGKPGTAGDPLNNSNYNWTAADGYVNYVVSNGAKAIIQFQPDNGTNPNITSPEDLGKIAYMITDRYLNGAYDSGFSDAIELFEFYPETDLLNSPTIESQYQHMFAYFSNFNHGVANARFDAHLRVYRREADRSQVLLELGYPTKHNYSVRRTKITKQNTLHSAFRDKNGLHLQTFDPFIVQFYKDCVDRNVPIKAATFHFVNLWFSFNPYDIKTITDKFRNDILIPAGLPDLEIWATHSGWSTSVSPRTFSSQEALNLYRDPQFFSAFNIGVLMYAQDTSVEHTILYPGLSYGGWGAGGFWYQGFFNKSAEDQPIPRNVAKAWVNYINFLNRTPNRLEVSGGSSDGFAVLAGRSNDTHQIQVFLNNYQLDYTVPQEILPYLNSSTLAYLPVKPDGLINGDQVCFADGNQLFLFPSCVTFAPVSQRNNTSNTYRLRVSDLPWNSTTRYYIDILRVGGSNATTLEFTREGQGSNLDITLDFPANAQDLITITKA